MKIVLGYTSLQRTLRVIALFFFFSFSLYYLFLVSLGFQFFSLPFVLLAFLFAVLSVDFLSGLLHWGADTWGTVEWPLVGRSIIQSFRLHHSDQKGITRHGFLETNGDVIIVAVLVQLLGLVLFYFFDFHYFFLCFFAFMTLIGVWTNQIHKWAHQERVPFFVSFLQKNRILLSPGHHGIHHAAPHERYYCITFGWMNPFLTAIHFFPFLEKIITFTIGLQPQRTLVVRKRKDKRLVFS